jgi:hypothetical protein
MRAYRLEKLWLSRRLDIHLDEDTLLVHASRLVQCNELEGLGYLSLLIKRESTGGAMQSATRERAGIQQTKMTTSAQ